jgi:hypothetical protein
MLTRGATWSAGTVSTSRSISRQARSSCPALLVAYAMGSIGQGAPFVVVTVVLQRRGLGAGWLALVTAARLAPYLACGPMAARLAGRHHAASVIAVAGALRAVLVALVALSLYVGSPTWPVMCLLLVVSVGTPCYPALMRTAGEEGAPDARSVRVAAVEAVSFCAGPMLGGLFLLVQPAGGLALTAATTLLFASAAVAIAACRSASPGAVQSVTPAPNRTSSTELLVVGVTCVPAVAGALAVNVLGGALLPLLAERAGGTGATEETAFGWLVAFEGLGAILAMLTACWHHSDHVASVGVIVASACVAGLAVSGSRLLDTLACTGFGVAVASVEIAAAVRTRQALSDHTAAAGIAVLDGLLVAAMVLGALLGAGLSALVGCRPAMAVEAAIVLLTMLSIRHPFLEGAANRTAATSWVPQRSPR